MDPSVDRNEAVATAAPQAAEAASPEAAPPSASTSASSATQGGGGRGWGTIGLAPVGAPPSHQRDVFRALEGARGQWAACRTGLALQDAITLRLTIDRQGKVVAAAALETTLSADETACVVRTVRGMALPPSQRASHTVEVPLTFAATFAATPASEPEAPRAEDPKEDPLAPGYGGAIQRAMRGKRGQFRQCFEASLRCCPNLSARLVVSFTVMGDGRVAGAREVSSDSVAAETVACVLDAVRTLALPAPPKGPIVVRYPIPFAPGS
jgi:hypothetical protein